MRIRVIHGIDDLANDMAAIPREFATEAVHVVRSSAERGNRLASRFAKESAGAHGKHYHRAFTVEAITPLSWEYGPDSSKPQGDMSFEFGSRNQPPHNDLGKSLDKVGPEFQKDVSDLADGLFW